MESIPRPSAVRRAPRLPSAPALAVFLAGLSSTAPAQLAAPVIPEPQTAEMRILAEMDLISPVFLALSVRDENGDPIPDATATYRKKGSPAWAAFWRLGPEIAFRHKDRPDRVADPDDRGVYTVYVRAPGRAPVQFEVDAPAPEPREVVLRPGRMVRLVLRPPKGQDVSLDLKPLVVLDDPDQRILARMTAADPRWAEWKEDGFFSFAKVVPLAGEFEFALPDPIPPFRILFHHEDQILGFETPLFGPEDVASGRLVVDLPAPGAIKAKLIAPETDGIPYYSNHLLTIATPVELGGRNWLFSAGQQSSPLGTSVLHQKLLPPGVYRVGAAATRGDETNPEVWRAEQIVRVRAGETVSLPFEAATFDRSAIEGDRSASFRIARPDGSPLKLARCSITYDGGAFGKVLVREITTDRQGVALAEGLAGGTEGPRFAFETAGIRVAEFRLTQPPGAPAEFRLTLPPVEGDMLPDVKLVDAATGEPMLPSSFRGKLLVLDFWAAGLPASHRPLLELDSIGRRVGAAAGDRFAVVAASLDRKPEDAAAFAAARGLGGAAIAWCPGDRTGFQSEAALALGLTTAPVRFLVSPQGRILVRAHPASFELEKRVADFLDPQPEVILETSMDEGPPAPDPTAPAENETTPDAGPGAGSPPRVDP